jgi:hypothetical protein
MKTSLKSLSRTIAHLFQHPLRTRHDSRRRWRPIFAPEVVEDRTLLSAGTLDPTFGVGGKVLTDVVGSARDHGQDLVIQPDGKPPCPGGSPPWQDRGHGHPSPFRQHHDHRGPYGG